MKLTTRKYFSFFITCLIICFAMVSFFGIHSRWGHSVTSHVKGWQNLRLGHDFENHIEFTFKPEGKVQITDENFSRIIKNRLNFLGFNDNKIDINPKSNSLTLKFTQPAGKNDLDLRNIVNFISSKGNYEIAGSIGNDEFSDQENGFQKITRNDLEYVKIVTKQNEMNPNKRAEPKYSLEFKLKKSCSKKLENLTNDLIQESWKNQKSDKDDNEKKSKLVLSINNIPAESKDVVAPMRGDKITFFNSDNLNELKQNLIFLNNKELPSNLLLKRLRKVSPEVGMWFKRCSFFTLTAVILAVILILTINFKTVGLACSVCLIGHMAFLLACFTGFFKIYPGVIFNFASFTGCMISILISIVSCFLISKKIQNYSEANEQPFSTAIKNGLSDSRKLITSWNLKLIIGSIILMAIFSYKTNLVAFALQPIYNLLDVNLEFNENISSIAYALLTGGIGAILFETFFIKYILEPVTTPKININLKNFKKLLSNLKFNIKIKNKPKKTKAIKEKN